MSDLRPIDCTACPIRHRAVCARCDAAELDQLAAIKTYRNFSAGAQICCSTLPSLVTSLCSSRIICTESVADIATIIVFTPYSTVTNY